MWLKVRDRLINMGKYSQLRVRESKRSDREGNVTVEYVLEAVALHATGAVQDTEGRSFLAYWEPEIEALGTWNSYQEAARWLNHVAIKLDKFGLCFEIKT